jgi:short-subunit dehydrogenase
VTVVHPGGVKTSIADAALDEARRRGFVPTEADLERHRTFNEKILRMPPEEAARIIVDGVEAGRPRILVGNDARLVDAIVRLLPARYPRIAVALARRVGR